ncbi:MAG: C40 family peptidase [Rhodobacteraceae bacterium]|nr:C40 family peptidase [Paracoccaceae bacterium]
MMDRRLTPANGRVAAVHLQGTVEAERFTEGELRQVSVPVASIWAAPDRARRERQVLLGEQVTVYEVRDGMAFVQSRRDGYVGYVSDAQLGPVSEATHAVSVPATHFYPAPDIKAPEVIALSFGARVRIVAGQGEFFETDQGKFIPKPHLRPLNRPVTDPVTVAQLHFGAPYLWGGNSITGIDCSGLVQAALLAAGQPCPADSDLQEKALGRELPEDTPAERGDLYFWKGHVAIAVDGETLIHANAYHMAVAYEPISEAIERIEAQGGGPVTARKRL